MTSQHLRHQYPKFIYHSFSHTHTGSHLVCHFKYSISLHHFTHTLVFENTSPTSLSPSQITPLIFNLGLAEMTNYWKLTCSPIIEVAAGPLSPIDLKFWHQLFLKGFGQLFYENHIDFTPRDFLSLISTTSPSAPPQPSPPPSSSSVLVPIGGGKDSIVTLELLKEKFTVTPAIVEPASPASYKITQLAAVNPPIVVRRNFDPLLFQLNAQGYLNGHVPYSAILAFIFLTLASLKHLPYIAVSQERSSDEANLEYLGQRINHQYSKTLEFETNFQHYIAQSLGSSVAYFSFLRPLYDLQITRLFSKLPQYFDIFRSCNAGRKDNRWCGSCPKCLSLTLSLLPWTNTTTLQKIFSGRHPLKDPANADLLKRMTDPTAVKPFECITTTKEAQICLEFITKGQTPHVRKFLSYWGPSAMPRSFTQTLKHAYAHS